MISVPFIYFSLIAFFLYRRHKRLDIATFIAIIYATSGFFSIIMEENGLSEHPSYSITFEACLFYCGLLTICLIPFIFYSDSLIKDIRPVKNEKLLRIIAKIDVVWMLLTVFFSWSEFYGVITGDMGALRNALYAGTAESGYMVSLPSPLRFLLSLMGLLFGCSWVHLFLAFFSKLIQKMPNKYFFMFMAASLQRVWTAVLGVDRSGVAEYVLSFIAILIFFWPFMERKFKRNLGFVSIPIFVGIGWYLVSMTMSRFGGKLGDDTEAVGGSLIYYLGSSYPEFSYFFDNVRHPYTSLNLLFPFISKYILGSDLVTGVVLNQYIEGKTGVFTGVFLTYIGQIQLTAGLVVAVVFCILFCVLGCVFFKRIGQGSVSAKEAFIYLLFAMVMVLGLFSYYYQTPIITASAVFFFFLFSRLGKKRSI